MAKKKTRQNTPVKKKSSLRSELEQGYLVAKKILRHFDLAPELIDVFTKKQRERLLHKFYVSPQIKTAKERTVPRQYVKNINTATFQFMKTHFWGNPDNELSYLELATYGLSFLSTIEQHYRNDMYAEGTPQQDVARQLCEKFDRDDVLNTAFKDVMYEVWYMTRSYSRVTYRMYGFELDCDKLPLACGCCFNYRVTIRLTAQECETKDFTYNNITRKAFRLFDTADGLYLPRPVQIPQNIIYHDVKDDKQFNVYVQSHAINRFKERLDIFEPPQQNLLFLYAFTRGLKPICFDKHDMLACMFEDAQVIGYFTFFVRGDDVVVNTFLPLVSPQTPEGKKLQKVLSINKEELAYLKMDKLKFYIDIDFEQIPQLKQALIDADIWPAKLILDRFVIDDEIDDIQRASNAKKTLFVKNFLDKRETYH